MSSSHGFRRFPFIASVASWLAPRNAKPSPKPAWKVVAFYDLLGSPVCLFRDPAGDGELALDYSTRERPIVPLARLSQHGRPISFAEFNGSLVAHACRGHAPVALVAPDGCAVVVTGKAALTRPAMRDARRPRWLRGLAVSLDTYRTMRRVQGDDARELIADSQRWDAHVPAHDLAQALARASDADLRSVGLQRRTAHDDLSTHPHGELPPVFIVASRIRAAEAMARIRRNARRSQARDGEAT